MHTTLRTRLVVGLAATALIAAGCGGDDDDESTADEGTAAPTAPADSAAPATTAPPADTPATTAAAGTTTPAATTAPSDDTSPATTDAPSAGGLPHATGDQTAQVMVITDVTQGPIAYSAPETYPAVQAALAGFPDVEVSVCDVKGDQNEYLNCQREAVDAGVDAVVVGWSAGGQAGEDLLYEAGIPVIGGGSVTAPLSYAFTSGSGSYVGLGAASAMVGCTDIGILHLEGTDQLADMIAAGAASQGASEVARAAVPSNAPDLSPAIAKLLGDGAQCIMLSVSPPMVVQAMTAISQSGETPMAAAISAILPQQLIDALGPLSEGMISVETTLSAADDDPVLEELQAAMNEFDPSVGINVQSTLGFVSGHALATAISHIDGEVTPAAIVEQLDGIADLDMGGIVPPVTIEALDSEALPRYMSPYAIPYIIQNGTPVRAADNFVSVKDAIEAHT